MAYKGSISAGAWERHPTVRPGEESAPTYNSPSGPPPGQLAEYWEAISRNVWMIAMLAVVGTALGAVFALVQKPLYRARTVLDIRSLDETMLSMQSGTGGMSNQVAGLPDAYLQTEIKLLQSESVLKRALSRMPQDPQTAPQRKLKGAWLDWFTPKQASLQDLVNDASRRIKVRALGNTRIVEILCDGRDGQVAATMCNSLAQTYIENNTAVRQQSTQETGQWLSSQLDNVRKRLTQSESALKDLSRSSPFSSELENPGQDKLRQLQAELSHAESERISRQAQYEVVLTAGSDSLPVGLDVGPIRDYRLRLVELQRQLAEASSTMRPEHYKVRELQGQIAAVTAASGKENADLLRRLSTDYESAKRREVMLATAYNSQASSMSEQGNMAVSYQMVKRDVDSGRRLYEVLLQKVEEVGLAAAMRTSTISVVDRATPPSDPYSPNWPASTGSGMVGATCLGMGLALFRARSDRTLRSPGEAPGQLNVRELGVIPSYSPRRAGKLLPAPFAGKSWPKPSRPASKPIMSLTELPEESLPLIGSAKHRDKSQSNVDLATLHRNPPEIAEAFCGTMESLLSTAKKGSGAKLIVLTSPEKEDGKTAVSANLAIALASTGRRVLLIDGDMRRPRLHEVFDLPTPHGLAWVLRGDEPIADEFYIARVALPTDVNGLHVLPTAAVDGGDIASLLHSDRLTQLLSRVREEYDLVLIDSPPMMLVSDARVMSAHADGALLVFRAGKTTLEIATAARQCLRDDGTRVIGTVLNDWSPRKSRVATYGNYSRA